MVKREDLVTPFAHVPTHKTQSSVEATVLANLGIAFVTLQAMS